MANYISNEEYVKLSSGCPDKECDSDKKVGGDYDYEGLKISQESTCLGCGLVFRDIYVLSGFEIVDQ